MPFGINPPHIPLPGFGGGKYRPTGGKRIPLLDPAPPIRGSEHGGNVNRGTVTVKSKPKVVAKFNPPVPKPHGGTVNNPKQTGTTVKVAGPKGKVPHVPVPKGPKPNGKTPTAPAAKTPKVSIGFDPKKMAQALTNQGYDADIAAIQREIDKNGADMASALEDIKGWTNQVQTENTRATGEQKAAWDAAAQQMQGNEANIANLFGGAAGAEAGAYGGVGQDMLSAIGASDQSFLQRMTPILSAQGQQYATGAQRHFQNIGEDLSGQMADLQHQKGDAYNKNLLDMMNMAWGRKQDIFNNQQQINQYNLAKQAADQAAQMSGIELAKGQQDIIQGNQQIESNNLSKQAAQVALQTAKIKMKQLGNSPGGYNLNSPQSRTQVAQAAFNGALNPNNGGFRIRPDIAYSNAIQALSVLGLQADPRALSAVQAAFKYALNLSHAHKKWGQWYFNQKGELVHNPTRKFKK